MVSRRISPVPSNRSRPIESVQSRRISPIPVESVPSRCVPPQFWTETAQRWLEGAGDELRPYQESIPTSPGALCSFLGRARDGRPIELLAGPPLIITGKTAAAETEFPRP